jgi:hypothetical protein
VLPADLINPLLPVSVPKPVAGDEEGRRRRKRPRDERKRPRVPRAPRDRNQHIDEYV